MNTGALGATGLLEEARDAAGLTPDQIADELGISRDDYERRIAGQVEFTAIEAKRMRRLLGVDLFDLL